jgi:hypothetical protein
LGDGRFRRPGCCVGRAGRWLRGAAHTRRDAHRERGPCLGAAHGQPAARQPWPGLAIQTGTAPSPSMGVLARVGHPAFSARQAVDLLGAIPVVTTAHPLERGPRAQRRDNALHGTITAPWAGPPGPASPRDAPCHDPHGTSHPTAWASGRRRHLGWEPSDTRSQVHWGLPRRWSSLEVVVDDNSPIALRWKPFQVRVFWRRYCSM